MTCPPSRRPPAGLLNARRWQRGIARSRISAKTSTTKRPATSSSRTTWCVVVVEHLAIANIVRRAKPVGDPDNPGQFLANGARAKSRLNRRISDAGWGQFVSILRAKAEDAGRTLIEVDPRHTSDGCEICGHAARENRSTQAVFTAPTLTNTPHATSCGLDWPTTLTQREKKLAAPPVREVTDGQLPTTCWKPLGHLTLPH